jgi:hypothetical protein
MIQPREVRDTGATTEKVQKPEKTVRDTYTRDHYNRVTTQSQKQRARGKLYPLKLVHNGWKRELLQEFGFGCDSLLDIGCGRGGDLQKW